MTLCLYYFFPDLSREQPNEEAAISAGLMQLSFPQSWEVGGDE